MTDLGPSRGHAPAAIYTVFRRRWFRPDVAEGWLSLTPHEALRWSGGRRWRLVRGDFPLGEGLGALQGDAPATEEGPDA